MSIVRFTHDGYGMLERNRVNPENMESQCALSTEDFPAGAEVGTIVGIDKAKKLIVTANKSKLKGILANSERTPDQFHSGLKNYHVEPGKMAAVLILEDGNIFTTNTLCYDSSEYNNENANLVPALKALASAPVYGDVDATTGVIKLTATEGTSPFTAVKYTTMPDGQPAVKFIVHNDASI